MSCFNGADTPIGTMPDFMRTVPVKKALDPDTLLAFEMNGERCRYRTASRCGLSCRDGPAIPGRNG